MHDPRIGTVIDGHRIEERLGEGGPYDPLAAAEVIAQIAGALDSETTSRLIQSSGSPRPRLIREEESSPDLGARGVFFVFAVSSTRYHR